MTFENPPGDAVPPAQPYPIPGQPYPGQPYPGQPYPGQPYPGQQYPGQQYPAPADQQYPAQQQYPGQQYPDPAAQQYPAQQQYPGQQYPDPSGQSWGAQPPQQQPWGTQQQPQQPWGTPQPGFAPPPPPKKSRTGLIVGGAVVVALALIGGVFVATSGGNNQPAALDTPPTDGASGKASSAPTASSGTSKTGTGEVAVPTSADGLAQMTGADGKARTDAMKKADASSSVYADALFGAYSKSGSSQYFSNLTLIPVATSSELQDELDASTASAFIAAVVDQTGLTDVATETTPMSGGAIMCGIDETDQITLRMCMWIDSNEYGLGAYPESTSNSAAAAYSNALWKASESN